MTIIATNLDAKVARKKSANKAARAGVNNHIDLCTKVQDKATLQCYGDAHEEK
jgi:hypothetical protein